METDRLILDSIKETDKEDYFINISHDKKVLETFICRYVETLEDFDFSAYLTAYQENNRIFAIRLKETGKLIGILISFDETEDSCEFGYGVGSGYWGHGYATEAVRRFLKYLLYEKGFRTIYASFFTGNDASRHVMEKCGMVYDHFSEKELTYLGVERDLTYYAIRRKTRVLLLNGPSSAGKSSIANVLQQRLRERREGTVIVSLDDYLQMSRKETIWEDDVFAVMPHMCREITALLQEGKMLIIDHVITSPRIFQALLDAITGYQMKSVLVSCPVETLQRREAERGDRCIGSAEASLEYLYPQSGYDMCLDSGTAGPENLAEKIMSIL